MFIASNSFASYLLAGEHGNLLRIVYRDSRDLERLHTEILKPRPGVVRVQSTLTLRKVKRTTKLPI
ncbi:MAG TPA: Lrp/AsnC ligand binding domain-containing protein [Methylomirabilota bacterium]|nr:Lrp/AsnC ligand binding domain-containing protein [Methylomirabilota bacterium]